MGTVPTASITKEEILSKFGLSAGNNQNSEQDLYNFLAKSNEMRKLISLLEEGPKPVDKLAEEIFPDEEKKDSINAIANLVAWADFAKNSASLSLLPARYHTFLSATKGIFCELAPTGSSIPWKSLALSQQDILNSEKKPYPFELGVCKICGEPYIMGVFVRDQKTSDERLKGFKYKPIADSYFEAIDSEDAESIKVILSHKPSKTSKEAISICRLCGTVGAQCSHPDSEKVTLYLLDTSQTFYNELIDETPDEESEETDQGEIRDIEKGCLNCGSKTPISKNILPLRFPSDGSSAPMVSTLFSYCPEWNQKKLDEEEEEFYSEYGRRNKDWTPIIANGRKLLIFSDSRQGAAFFGPYMQVSHNQLVFNRFMIDILKSKPSPISIEEWHENANARIQGFLNSRLRSAILLKDLRPSEKFIKELINNNTSKKQRIYHSICHLIDRTASSISRLEGIGIGAVYFDDPSFANFLDLKGLSKENILALAQLILRSIRLAEAFYLSPEEDINLSIHDTYFGYRYARVVIINEEGKSKGATPVFRLISKKPNQLQNLIRCSIAKMKGIASDSVLIEEVREVIDNIAFKFIKQELTADPKGIGYQLDITKLKIMPANPQTGEFSEPIPGGLPRFKSCKKCGRLSWIDLNNLCNYANCFGELIEPHKSLQFSEDNHYRNLFLYEKEYPELRAVEHTAQLDKESAAPGYQKEFKRGRLNILSCSTTFEMGVDLGDLSVIFMRNIPPNIANYVQRAGRAGRRPGISPFVLTFCRNMPHDQYFFNNYKLLVKGEVNPPAIVLENEKIIRRHCNAVIISDFLKEFKPAFSNGSPGYIKDPCLTHLFEPTEEFNKLVPSNLRDIEPYKFLCQQWLPDRWNNYNKKLKEIFSTSDYKNSDFFNSGQKFIDDFVKDFVEDKRYGLQNNIGKKYQDAISFYKGEMKKYDLKDKKQRRDYEYFEKLLDQTRKKQLISYLSSHGFLPSYAFPTNVVPLEILSGNAEAKLLDLNRELGRAISEYAPGSEVVANSRIYESGALHKFPKQVFKKYFYYHCKAHNWFICEEDKNIVKKRKEQHLLEYHKADKESNNDVQRAIYPEWGFSVPRDKKGESIRINTKRKRIGYSSELLINAEGFRGDSIQVQLPQRGSIKIELANGYDMYRVNAGKMEKSDQNLNGGKGKKGFDICEECGRSLKDKEKKHQNAI